MAEADRIAAALRYQQELDAAQRPATMNPNIAAQGLKSRNRIAAELASQPQSWSGEALPMEGRAAFLPFQDTMPGSVMNTRSLALPGIVAGAVNAITAPGRALVDPEFNQGEEAANVALNVMGGGMAIGKAPAGSLGMNVTSKGRIPETGVDTRKLADMLERAGVKSGYEIAREGSAVSPSQYITFRNPADELATRQVRISNHADKYPELASGVRTSVDPATEVSFEQAVNWLAKEGYPTSLSNKYKNIPSWEQYYAQQQSLRESNKLQSLIDSWRNKPKATRGPIPTELDLLIKENK
jgi:hypothetical protein